MKETRKPYTVASYEAGKKAETRDGITVEIISFDKLHEAWPFEGYVGETTQVDIWSAEGTYRRPQGKPSRFDLFEKED